MPVCGTFRSRRSHFGRHKFPRFEPDSPGLRQTVCHLAALAGRREALPSDALSAFQFLSVAGYYGGAEWRENDVDVVRTEGGAAFNEPQFL